MAINRSSIIELESVPDLTGPRLSPTTLGRRPRPTSTLYRVPFSKSPYPSPTLHIDTTSPYARSNEQPPSPFRSHGPPSSSQTTIVNWPSQSELYLSKGLKDSKTHGKNHEEVYLHVTPLPHESPADALTRPHSLSPRDIDAIAHHLCLDYDQRQKIPNRCRPVDLQHHIQVELMRRVHLGIDIGPPRHPGHAHHRRFLLSDSPFAFEIRQSHSKGHSHQESEDKHRTGPGKHAFKKPVIDMTETYLDEHEKKSATWMELFFDLTFVANITIFTHQHPIVDTTTLMRYCGWFTILWWMWLSQTMFDVRFSTDDLLNRIWKLVQFFALAAFAGNGDHFTSTNSNGFALSYAVMKLVLVGQYFIVWVHAPNKTSRRPIMFYMAANFVSFVMWWTSAFIIELLSDRARYGIWFSAIAIEVVTNIALANNTTVSFVRSHLPERLGLFTLIILGESIMGLFVVTDDLVDAPGKLGWDNLTLLIFSITIIKCQWFLYFDDYHEQCPVRSSIHSTLWTYLHFMLNMSQLLLGVGCLDLIRIYQLTKEPTLIPIPHHLKRELIYPDEATGSGSLAKSSRGPNFIMGGGEDGPSHDLILVYVKKYYLIVAASVFFWNAAIKYVTSRPGDKYDRAIYVSRFFMSFVVLCLLLVEHQRLGAFSLLGLEVGFCLLQVGHDLLVLYYAARKDFENQNENQNSC
ncbi:hypothetical protein CPB97_011122 [Podila verticillata]|nr:hypothetical protein CPB97_011122 [Podila verticillata]